MGHPSTSSARRARRLPGEAGIALYELTIAGSALAITACGLSVVAVSSLSTSARNRETAQARMSAWQLLEQLQNIPVGDVYSTFNTASNDDPPGDDTAPGGVFMIESGPAAIQVGNRTGEILFPESDPGVSLSFDVRGGGLDGPPDDRAPRAGQSVDVPHRADLHPDEEPT
jgi:hypothetical protein